MVKRADSHSTGHVSSNPTCVAIKKAVSEEGKGKWPSEIRFSRKNSEPGIRDMALWFLLRSKSSMQRSSTLGKSKGKALLDGQLLIVAYKMHVKLLIAQRPKKRK